MEHELTTGEWVALAMVMSGLLTLLVLMIKGYDMPKPPPDMDKDPPPENRPAA